MARWSSRLESFTSRAHWSQVAADILAQKYFRKAGVPAVAKKVEETSVPSWLWRSVADEAALAALPEEARFGGETDARQVFDRLAGTWTYWGWKAGYFSSEEDASAFYRRAPLHARHADGRAQQPAMVQHRAALGLRHRRPEPGSLLRRTSPRARSRHRARPTSIPQPHACFIQSIEDDLVNEGGIMDLWVREARLFKYGSGTGSNFSMLRGENEPLSGGGKSSGLMSFLKIGDRAAGAIKSGGTTRRAAKMVVVDIDHPDIEDYINWKVIEEQKVAALVTGSKILSERLNAILKACVNCEADGDGCFDRQVQSGAEARGEGRAQGQGAGQRHPPGDPIRPPGLHLDPFPDLRHRLGLRGLSHCIWAELKQLGARHRRVPARGRGRRRLEPHLPQERQGRQNAKSARAVGGDRHAAWACADPGIQFDTTINDWHTCPASGPIKASNPCSEYMFLDDTACNLASLNLMAFRHEDGSFDVEAYEHAIRLWTVVLEIAVTMAQFPSRRIAQLSYEYRTLGLGYANIGGLLMASGIPYDSPEGRSLCGALSAIMTGVSYATSADMARELGAVPRLCAEPRTYAPRHAQSCPRGARRKRGL